MKRTNETELIRDDKKSKKEINDKEYSEILELMLSLSNIIMGCTGITGRDEYISIFNKFKDSIPGLVVWGNQSTGKTSLLKRMFPFLSQKECEGLGTRCPIELKKSIFYTEDSVHIIDGNGNRIDHNPEVKDDNYVKKLISVAENTISLQFPNTDHIDCKIVIEMKSDSDNLIITDLPGCIVNDPSYFNNMKELYLKKNGNIIIYVARGDVDPASDISLEFLKGIQNDQICVLTHTDYWNLHPEKIYLEKYKKIFKNIFLVNTGNELDIPNKYKNDNDVKIGTQYLLNEMNITIKNKIFDSLSIFAEKVNILETKTTAELRKVGEYPLNKQIILNNYLVQLNKFITNNFNKLIVDKRSNITYFTHIKNYSTQIPQVNELVKKIQDSDEILGWESLFKKYIDDMKNSVFVYLSNIMDTYFNNVFKNLLTIDYNYNSRTKNIEILIKEKIREFIENTKEKSKNALNKLIDRIMSDHKDRKYMEKYQIEITKFRTKEMSCNTNRSSFQFGSSGTTPVIFSDDPYLVDAKEHRILLSHIWNYKCEKIMEIFCDPIEMHKNILKNNILEMIETINSNDIDDETAEIVLYRNTLIKIEDLCRKIKIYSYQCEGINQLLTNYLSDDLDELSSDFL